MSISVFKNLKIMVLYKRSSFLANNRSKEIVCPSKDRFRRNHINHYESLSKVEAVLQGLGLSYRKHCRSRTVDYSSANLVITVGGDGTFLEAARKVNSRQYVLGVNSDPQWSVGHFCCCDANGFLSAMKKFLAGRIRTRRLHKLLLKVGSVQKIECLNDILICHANPAAMSRYELMIGKSCEEQRSSGVWFSTAAGSTGAIFSAGGKKMPLDDRRLQYKPRELYQGTSQGHALKGGFISSATILSRMPFGAIFVDGSHIKIPFKYGEKAVVSSSPNYVNIIHA